MVLFHRETGVRGSEAQLKLEEFYRDRMPNLWKAVPISPQHNSTDHWAKKKSPLDGLYKPRPTSTARAPLPMRSAVSKPPPKPVYDDFSTSADPDIQIVDPVEECYQEPDPNLKDVMFEPPTRVWSPRPKESGTLSVSSDSESSDSESSTSSGSESEQDRPMDLSIKVVEHPVLDKRLVQDRKRKVKMDKLNDKRSHIKSLFFSDSEGESSTEVIKNTQKKQTETSRQTQKQKPGERRTQEDKTNSEIEKSSETNKSNIEMDKTNSEKQKRSETKKRKVEMDKTRSEKEKCSETKKTKVETDRTNSEIEKISEISKVNMIMDKTNSEKQKSSETNKRNIEMDKTNSETEKHSETKKRKVETDKINSEIEKISEINQENMVMDKTSSEIEECSETKKIQVETDKTGTEQKLNETDNRKSETEEREQQSEVNLHNDFQCLNRDEIQWIEDNWDTNVYFNLQRLITTLKYDGSTKPRERISEKEKPRALSNVAYKTFHNLQQVQEAQVTLVIGGKTFVTSRVTLRADPDSLLAQMLRPTCPMRPSGHIYFFDRDPAHFRFVLNYLRNGGHLDSMTLPHEKRYLLELLTECRFFCLRGLEEIVLDRLEQLTQSRNY